MKLQLRRYVCNRARQVLNSWRGVGSILCTLICIEIMSLGVIVPATQADTIVQFDLNYSVDGSSGPIDSFEVQLYDSAAPITVANFLKYVNDGLYDNTIFHRSVENFIVQGGGFAPTVENGVTTALDPITNYGAIQNEFSSARSNVSGTIAMAKLGGDPNSATNQWFVNVEDNSANLDNQNGGFTVFGKVLGDGMTLINAISKLTVQDVSQSFGDTFTDVPMFNNGTSFVTITKAAVVTTPTPTPTPTATGSGKLSGVIYYDKNHNGLMDGDDYLIAGAQVLIMQAGSSTPLATVYTAADGSYQFDNLAAGTFSVSLATTNNGSDQDGGKGQMILDKAGTIISIGADGAALQNAYGNISLGDGQKGTNFNIAQSAYPVSLLSARMMLGSAQMSHANAVAVPGTNAAGGSVLAFGNVLVGTPDNTTLTVTNLGIQGSALSGTFPGASGDFSPTGTSAFGPLGSGQEAGRQYTYTPAVRGSNTQDINVASNVGNVTVTLSGTGVAPVQKVDTTAADAKLVRIGTIGTANVTIKNVGDGNLSGVGESSNLTGSISAGSGLFTGAGGSISLGDNASKTFSFTYTPTARTTDSTTIAVNFSNGSADGKNLAETVNAQLSGHGVGPVFSSDLVPGSTLDFGTVPQANTKSLALSISNASTDSNGGDTSLTDLTLLSAEITGPDSSLFSIVGFTADTILHEGDPLSLTISYNGTGAHGARSAVLTILTDEGAAFGADGNAFTYQISASLAPEPSSLMMLSIAGLFIGGLTWRRRAVKKS
jgi:peptidyl-prolyl cis-trans isomerase A (cyclophilin A)